MTLEKAQALSARIHEAAKALNTLIYEASADGLDVGLEIAETHVVHGAPIKTVQTHVSLPLDAPAPKVVKFVGGKSEAADWINRNPGALAAIRGVIPAVVRDAQHRGKL